ncbi:hypothetical protein A4X09_0g7482 [Tilletia walkeri]|uniref:Uncharacterized protein n=1 Tax=Tilletia walkeri TaxID=117179 RepID=A0A8X7T1L9_9BASI|nr:hypothetical protein A4X09_0g7482 [Tilletia walkeri]
MQLESEAAGRFFATPELVKNLLEYFSRDRVDLLMLALVSKSIRIQALRVWVRYLDLPVSAARRRFNFLEANTDLVAHIRYVRIRSDVRERGLFSSTIGCKAGLNDQRLRLRWALLSNILNMVANRPTPALSLLFLDVTVAPEDPVQIPRALMKRVVALRIIYGPIYSCHSEFDPSFNIDGAKSSVPPTEGEDSTEDGLSRPWDKLAEVIQAASEGPGIHTFQIGNPGADVDGIDVDSYFRCWSLLIEHHDRTLRSLSVSAEPDSLPEDLLTVSFSQLRDFQLSQYDGNSELLQAFLDHHPSLRRLDISVAEPSEPYVEFTQTFPDLSDIYITTPFPGLETAERHPQVISNIKNLPREGWGLQDYPEFETSTEYPNQRFVLVFDSESLEEMVAAGRLLSHIYIGGLGRYEDLDSYLPILTTRPETAQAVTCLQLDVWEFQRRNFFRSFDPTIFENLAEVGIRLKSSTEEPRRRIVPSVESPIASAISHFVPARSLRVLCICEGQARCPSNDILLDHEFPPALEYFGWLGPPVRVPQYFRFVSSDPCARAVKTEAGVKRGRLQRVPSIFRAKITPCGVWERPLHSDFQMTVLDHISGPPTLVLS